MLVYAKWTIVGPHKTDSVLSQLSHRNIALQVATLGASRLCKDRVSSAKL